MTPDPGTSIPTARPIVGGWNRRVPRSLRPGRAVPSLRLSGVGKSLWSLGAEFEALRSIDLDVAPGELVCLLGPHGCGTSMLLSMIAGLEPVTHGRIWSHGRRIRRVGGDRALLFQDTGLSPWLDARGNVALALRDRGLPAFERAAIARRCLDLVSMHRFERTPACDLSEGHQQRVALARALATDPTILLMDEPFVRLEPRTRERLHDELQAVWTATRTTILFATHDPYEAVLLADRVIVLSPQPGRIVAEIHVDLPRPRRASDGALEQRAREVLRGMGAAAA